MSLLTRKQFAILNIIVEGNQPGADERDQRVDLDEIIERIPYETTKAAIQFSIRSMINNEFIFKNGNQNRRGRQRVLFSATRDGIYRIKPETLASEPSYIVSPEEDYVFGTEAPEV